MLGLPSPTSAERRRLPRVVTMPLGGLAMAHTTRTPPWRVPATRGILLGTVPNGLTDPLDSTQRGAGAADLYFRDDSIEASAARTGPHLLPSCSPPGTSPLGPEAKITGVGRVGESADTARTPPAPPGSSLGGSQATFRCSGGKNVWLPRFPADVTCS